jgi:hypothetical protein
MLTTLSLTLLKPVVIAVIISSGIVFLLSGIGRGYGCRCLVCISNRFCGGLTWLVGCPVGLSRWVVPLGCPVGLSRQETSLGFLRICWEDTNATFPTREGRSACGFLQVPCPPRNAPPWHVYLTREAVTLHGVWVPACWSSRHHGCAIVTAAGDCVFALSCQG